MIKQQLEDDVKAALLAGDRLKIDTLRGLKSAILYEEVAKGKRETGLSDEEVMTILAREAKKRQESADLYTQGGDQTRADKELQEKIIIEAYLPKQLSEAELKEVIDQVVANEPDANMQAMGKIIGAVKQQVGAAGDGALIARLVRERLSA